MRIFYEVDLLLWESAATRNLCPQYFARSKFLGKLIHPQAANLEIFREKVAFSVFIYTWARPVPVTKKTQCTFETASKEKWLSGESLWGHRDLVTLDHSLTIHDPYSEPWFYFLPFNKLILIVHWGSLNILANPKTKWIRFQIWISVKQFPTFQSSLRFLQKLNKTVCSEHEFLFISLKSTPWKYKVILVLINDILKIIASECVHSRMPLTLKCAEIHLGFAQ